MKDSQSTLKKERNKLLDAWRDADAVQKNSIIVRIIDIDEELEKYQPIKYRPMPNKHKEENNEE